MRIAQGGGDMSWATRLRELCEMRNAREWDGQRTEYMAGGLGDAHPSAKHLESVWLCQYMRKSWEENG